MAKNVSEYYKSIKMFRKYKWYFDDALNGNNIIHYPKAESLARILRAIIRGLRERKEMGYEDFYNARIKVINANSLMIDFVKSNGGNTNLNTEVLDKEMTYHNLKVFEIIVTLKDDFMYKSITFQDPDLNSEKEYKMIESYCEANGFKCESVKDRSVIVISRNGD